MSHLMPACCESAEPDYGSFADDLRSLRPKLTSYARSIARDRDVADDLVQETMLKAWRSRARFDPGTSMRAWTFTILRNTYLSACRRAVRTIPYEEVASEQRLIVAEQQSTHMHLKEATRFIHLLPNNQRVALLLVAVGGLPYDEAAAVAGIPVNTLRSRVGRARARLNALADGSVAVTSISPPTQASRTTLPKGVDRRSQWAIAKANGTTLWIG